MDRSASFKSETGGRKPRACLDAGGPGENTKWQYSDP